MYYDSACLLHWLINRSFGSDGRGIFGLYHVERATTVRRPDLHRHRHRQQSANSLTIIGTHDQKNDLWKFENNKIWKKSSTKSSVNAWTELGIGDRILKYILRYLLDWTRSRRWRASWSSTAGGAARRKPGGRRMRWWAAAGWSSSTRRTTRPASWPWQCVWRAAPRERAGAARSCSPVDADRPPRWTRTVVAQC